MKIFSLVIALVAACFPASLGLEVPGNAYDHVKNAYIPEGIRWLEVGFFLILPDVWTTVEATYHNFSDPVVFLSLPNLAGDTSQDGTSMSLRVNNTQNFYVNHDTKDFSFEAKSLNANDTFCSKVNELYTPQALKLNASFIGWLVVERGKFNISHKAFIINTDVINRTNVNDSTDPRNQFKSFSQSGICDFGINCRMNNPNNLLTMGQLQTTRFDRFLLLRGIGAGRRFVVYLLLPHDSLEAAGFYVPSPGENYAWMLFEEGLQVSCVENLVIETYLQLVTYIRVDLTYANTFTVAPAVFGMVQTLLGRDSLGLRAFNIGVTSSSFITQEDKCTDAETQHTTEEEAALLIIGRVSQGTTICGATFNDNQPTAAPTAAPTIEDSAFPTASPTAHPTADPTSSPSAVPTADPTAAPSRDPTSSPTNAPTAAPSTSAPSISPTFAPTRATNSTWCTYITFYDTFGDGWGPDIALQVTLDTYNEFSTLLEPLYLYYECPEGAPKEYCWQSEEEVTFDIVCLNPPCKETWEIYWTVHWVVENRTDETFLGDYDTSMVGTQTTFDVTDPVDYSNRTCDVCKHPPKPKSKSSSSSKSSSTSKSSSRSSKGMLYDDDVVDDVSSSKGSGTGSGSGAGKGGKKKAKSKAKPHWPFPVTIFDTNGDGWFNSSEAWTPVPLHSCGGGVSYPQGRALPETLAAPEYIISTIDRVNPLRRNTICGDLLREDCEERLPDAKYIFRVTGDLSKFDTVNNTFWHFCGRGGTAKEELEFKLVKGKCFPGKKISAEDICCGDVTASYSGLLTLYGVSDDALSEYDTAVLEHDIAEAFSSELHGGIHGSISLTSWTVSDGNLLVSFSMVFKPMDFGMSGMYTDDMENLQSTLLSSSESYINTGQFVGYVQSMFTNMALEKEDPLMALSGASISDITYLETSVGGFSVKTEKTKVATADNSLSGDAMLSSSKARVVSGLVHFEEAATVIFAALAAALVAVVVYSSLKSGDDTLTTESSRELLTEEADRSDSSDLLVTEIPPSDF